MYICICNPVTDAQLRRAISEGCQSLDDLQTNLGVATSCGRCAESACAILQAEVNKRAVSRRYIQKSA